MLERDQKEKERKLLQKQANEDNDDDNGFEGAEALLDDGNDQ